MQTDFVYERIFYDIPSLPPSSVNMFEGDLYNFIEHLTTRKFIRNPKNEKEMLSLVAISQFSFIVTLLFAMKKTNLLRYDREFLCIHIVGAKTEVTYLNENSVCLFYTFMPRLIGLKFVLIGPETSNESYLINCSGRFSTVESYQTYYQCFAENIKPDLVVCFNCGFSEIPWGVPYRIGNTPTMYSLPAGIMEPNWVGGLRKIMYHRVPFLFTSYSIEELRADLDLVRRVAEDLDLGPHDFTSVFCAENPYRDPRPFRNFEPIATDPSFYMNSHLLIFDWKKNMRHEDFMEKANAFRWILFKSIP